MPVPITVLDTNGQIRSPTQLTSGVPINLRVPRIPPVSDLPVLLNPISQACSIIFCRSRIVGSLSEKCSCPRLFVLIIYEMSIWRFLYPQNPPSLGILQIWRTLGLLRNARWTDLSCSHSRDSTGIRCSVSFSTCSCRASLPSDVIWVTLVWCPPFSSIFLSHEGIFFSWAWGPSSARWSLSQWRGSRSNMEGKYPESSDAVRSGDLWRVSWPARFRSVCP